MINRTVFRPLVCTLVLLACSTQGGINAGRAFDDDERPMTINLTLGQFKINSGKVEETRRAYDNNEKPTGYEAFLSSYSFEELGLVGSYPTYGLNFEKQWKYFTLRVEGSYIKADASAVASMHPTASDVPDRQKGYYISVGEVSSDGQTYERMFIPDGQPFDVSVDGGSVAIRGLITPFSLSVADNLVSFSPWLHLGVYAVGGSYTIDAGPARGTVQYEVPPETYVVGGRGEGDVGAALPEIGFGGELRIRLARMRNGDATLSLQGDLAYLTYNGNTGDLGISEENEKEIDLTYQNLELSAMLELPVSPRFDLVMGIAYRVMTATIDLNSQNRDEQDQETTYHEKYDKHADFDSSFLYGSVGLRF
jgi:hypothetical protein